MSAIESLLLGLLQGLTEFLPISSSGHLALARHLLDLGSEDLAFVVFVHFGTLLATVTAFWTDVRSMVVSSGRFVVGSSAERALRPKGSESMRPPSRNGTST